MDEIKVSHVVTLLIFTGLGIGIGWMLWGNGSAATAPAAKPAA